MFQAVPPPIISSSKLYTHHRVIVELLLLLTAYVSELGLQSQLTHASGSSKQARQIPDAVYTVLSS